MLPPCPEDFFADGIREIALLTVSLLMWTMVALGGGL